MKIASIRQKKLITAIKTPYLKNGEIDVEVFDNLVERQIKNGVEGIVVGGTTGEGHLLSWEDHLMLIAHASHKFGSRLMIVGNTGSNNTKESFQATAHGFNAGMHVALLINPYYGKTSLDGLLVHFKECLKLGPAIIYNVPMRTAQDIPKEVITELADCSPNLVGVKECMGTERISEYYANGIFCWVGVDEQTFKAYHKCHALGVISVASNIVPGLMRKLLDTKDEVFEQSLHPFFRWLGIEPNPIPLNSILADLRLTKPVFRLPYCPLSYELRKKGVDLLKKIDPSFANAEILLDDKFIST
ncbi:MAG: dihydrodipicolinate synthase family protein [SAR324 cluster bacterium]|nr:dihydrodipicolinate synthase family protein [SAR324 cluster bacterium]